MSIFGVEQEEEEKLTVFPRSTNWLIEIKLPKNEEHEEYLEVSVYHLNME